MMHTLNIARLSVRLAMGGAVAAIALMLLSVGGRPAQAEEVSKIAHGGKLYDKWYQISGGDIPRKTNASYPKAAKKKGKTTWRCKECHGWDYRGADGAYGNKKNSHYTGLKGIRGAAGKDPAKIIAILKGKAHGYTSDMLTDEEFDNLALFVSKGQVDMAKFIDASGKVKGNKGRGAGFYGTVCAGCHGLDGKKIKDMPPVGEVAGKNPWESLHKVMNGQPGEPMPALRAFPLDIAVDIVAYAATLPR